MEYPIYKQTGGQKDFHYMKIDVDEERAPWMITDKEGKVLFR